MSPAVATPEEAWRIVASAVGEDELHPLGRRGVGISVDRTATVRDSCFGGHPLVNIAFVGTRWDWMRATLDALESRGLRYALRQQPYVCVVLVPALVEDADAPPWIHAVGEAVLPGSLVRTVRELAAALAEAVPAACDRGLIPCEEAELPRVVPTKLWRSHSACGGVAVPADGRLVLPEGVAVDIGASQVRLKQANRLDQDLGTDSDLRVRCIYEQYGGPASLEVVVDVRAS